MWLGVFGQLLGGPVPLVTRGAAVLVLCAARLAGLVTPALSQPLGPDPWASELCPFQPVCSSPGVKRLPTKPGRPGKLGAPGLGLEQPAHWDLWPVRGGAGRGGSCGLSWVGVGTLSQDGPGSIRDSVCILSRPALSHAGHGIGFWNQGQDAAGSCFAQR